MGGDLQQILCVCAAPFTHPIPSHPTHRQTQRRCLLVFSHVDYIIYHRYQAPRRSLCAALGLIFSVNLELNANLFAQSCFQMFSICVSMLYGLYVCLCLHIHTPPTYIICSWTWGTAPSHTAHSSCLFLIVIFSIRSRCRACRQTSPRPSIDIFIHICVRICIHR